MQAFYVLESFREVLINTLKRLISTSRQIAVSQRLTVSDLQSATYGQLATFEVNTEKSSIGFIQCFLSEPRAAGGRKNSAQKMPENNCGLEAFF